MDEIYFFMSPQVKEAIDAIGMVLAISILLVAIYFLVNDIVNHYKAKKHGKGIF